MSDQDIEFFLRRSAEEYSLAASCGDPMAAQIHRQMAAVYADRAAALEIPPNAPLTARPSTT